MKQSIGGISMLNIIIIFIVLIFAFLAGTISYYKAYKVNNKILKAIETYEGYNNLSQEEINNSLAALGYNKGNSAGCNEDRGNGKIVRYNDNGHTLLNNNIENTLSEEQYDYCIYVYNDTGKEDKNNNKKENYYYSYGVVTYIHIDLPLVKQLIRIPIFTRTEKIYKFDTE